MVSFAWRRYFLVIALLLIHPIVQADPIQTRRYQNRGVDPETNQERYLEETTERVDAGQAVEGRVIYRIPPGTIVARKQIHFGPHPAKPSFRFDDERDGYAKGVTVEGDTVTVYFRPTGGGPFQSKVLKIPEPVVIDAGVHYFIQAHWQTLIQGDPLAFNFVIPRRLDYYRLQITRTDPEQKGPETRVRFDIKPANLWLSLGSGITGWGTTRLTYDVKTREPLEYEGVSLIHDENGKSYPVKGIYHYPP
ncbi:hypothetical protein KKI24_02025 [bacterium]|nr:hypothetical protein [bacterium]